MLENVIVDVSNRWKVFFDWHEMSEILTKMGGVQNSWYLR